MIKLLNRSFPFSITSKWLHRYTVPLLDYVLYRLVTGKSQAHPIDVNINAQIYVHQCEHFPTDIQSAAKFYDGKNFTLKLWVISMFCHPNQFAKQ